MVPVALISLLFPFSRSSEDLEFEDGLLEKSPSAVLRLSTLRSPLAKEPTLGVALGVPLAPRAPRGWLGSFGALGVGGALVCWDLGVAVMSGKTVSQPTCARLGSPVGHVELTQSGVHNPKSARGFHRARASIPSTLRPTRNALNLTRQHFRLRFDPDWAAQGVSREVQGFRTVGHDGITGGCSRAEYRGGLFALALSAASWILTDFCWQVRSGPMTSSFSHVRIIKGVAFIIIWHSVSSYLA